jgi:hypothetical protein
LEKEKGISLTPWPLGQKRATAQPNSGLRPPQDDQVAGPHSGLRSARSAHSDADQPTSVARPGHGSTPRARRTVVVHARRAAWSSHRRLVGDRDRARCSQRGSPRKVAHAWQRFSDRIAARRRSDVEGRSSPWRRRRNDDGRRGGRGKSLCWSCMSKGVLGMHRQTRRRR